MREFLDTHKPSVAARWHLMLAATLWSLVGTALLTVGLWWSWGIGRPAVRAFLPIAVIVGALKGLLLIDRTADRIIDRIVTRGDGRCIGGFLSWQTWLFVLLMMTAGRLLRGSPLPRGIIGLLYTAVGLALLIGCRRLWKAWHRHRRQEQATSRTPMK